MKKPETYSRYLLATYRPISEQMTTQRLQVILTALEKVLQSELPGDVVEFGCYIGTTSLYIGRLLDHYGGARQFHVYDSFEGLPPKQKPDESPSGRQFKAGELAVAKKAFIGHFKKAGVRLPIIHKGWFEQLDSKDVPSRLAFAFIDGDFYGSILASLKLAWPKLEPGGIIALDDFNREALPGVTRATAQYFGQGMPKLKQIDGIGLIQKD